MICAVQEAVVGVSTLFYGVILNEGVAMEACVEQLVYTPLLRCDLPAIERMRNLPLL